MSAQTSASGRTKRSVRVEVTLAEPRECGGTLEFGLQTAKDELDFGVPAGDGAIRYTAEIGVGTREDGTATYSGTAVNGPSRARFVYLSHRAPGAGADWTRRCKIPLPERLEQGTTLLAATVEDTGATWAKFDGWTQT
ncbi:DUF5990 family protein [Actinokineospora guangxiensis]|uniref:DUF5990 family protein n=1 Tax=Actinokineospora guangxiensis TaxID=1490288 RepID=A0ABW0ERA0_9PSEU